MKDWTEVHRDDIRPQVIRMARMMEFQLRRNDHRGGWHNCDRVYFLEKLEINLRDLRLNLAAGAHEQAQRDCADLANFAMMMAETEQIKENAKHITPEMLRQINPEGYR